jgi:hypothetical protein
MSRPKARTNDIVVQKLANETLIYCRQRHRASYLNEFAGAVFDRCDGRTSPADIAHSISSVRDHTVDERAVWLALDQLSRSDLLEDRIVMPPSVLAGASRRHVLKALGLSSAAAIPAVATILVPSASYAASCAPSGTPCDFGNPGACCSLTCRGQPSGPPRCD